MSTMALVNADGDTLQNVTAIEGGGVGTAKSMVDEELLNHLLVSIARAEGHTEPFSHLYFNKLFPEPLYKKMLSMQPEGEAYKGLKHKEALRSDGSSTRQVFPFNDQRLNELDEEKRAFWVRIQATLADERFQQTIFKRLASGIGERLGLTEAQAASVPAWPKGGLFIDKSGYRISPHRDVFTKLVTMQFYLPGDESQRDLGTSLYSRDWIGRLNREFKKLGLKKIGRKSLREFTHEKTFPFMPNSGYAFVVGQHSWHGREPLPENNCERRSLMHIYYLKPDVKFYDN